MNTAAAEPYLDTVSSDGGVPQEDVNILDNNLWRQMLCKKTAMQFFGVKTGKKYYKFMPCLKWWCTECGRKNGTINMKRFRRVMKNLTIDKKNAALRQIVFTVPEEVRGRFKDRKSLNALLRMSQKVVKGRFPGKQCISSIHLFGEHSLEKFHPHVHIAIIDNRNQKLTLSKDELNAIRSKWKLALQGFLQERVRTPNIHVSYAISYGKIIHRLKYITRPMPGPANFWAIQGDLSMLVFLINKLSGFIYVRYFNGCRKKATTDNDMNEELKEAESLTGEKLIYVVGGNITKKEFHWLYRSFEYEEISPGFFRINR